MIPIIFYYICVFIVSERKGGVLLFNNLHFGITYRVNSMISCILGNLYAI